MSEKKWDDILALDAVDPRYGDPYPLKIPPVRLQYNIPVYIISVQRDL